MTGDKQGPLERYLMVLEMVAASHDGLNMTDIANLTGLPKPTVHRLTRVLLEAGALETDGGRFKSFRIGPRLWRILYLGLGRDQVANMGSGRLRRTGRETARDLFHLPPWPEDHPLDRPPRARPGPSPARVTGRAATGTCRCLGQGDSRLSAGRGAPAHPRRGSSRPDRPDQDRP